PGRALARVCVVFVPRRPRHPRLPHRQPARAPDLPRAPVDHPPRGQPPGRGGAQAALLGAVLPAPEPGFPDRRAAVLRERGQPQPLSGADHRPGLPRAAPARDQAQVSTTWLEAPPCPALSGGAFPYRRVFFRAPTADSGAGMRRRIVAGNWKLYGTRDFATSLVAEVAAQAPVPGVELVVMPPMPYLGDLIEDFEGSALVFGAQDVSPNMEGAYTGEVSARMVADVGARYALCGHSERRRYHAES